MMRRAGLPLSISAALLILGVVPVQLSHDAHAERSAAPALQPDPSDEASLLADVAQRSGVMTDVHPVELSFGDYITVHLLSEAFYEATVTENLSSELIQALEWVVPVYHEGGVVAAANIYEVHTGPEPRFMLTSLHESEFGDDLLGLNPTDKLLHVMEDSSWYVISGEQFSAFNSLAEYRFPGTPLPLSDLQEYSHAQWQQGSTDPPGYFRGGGGAPSSGAQGRRLDRDQLFGAILAVLAVAGLLLFVRRSS